MTDSNQPIPPRRRIRLSVADCIIDAERVSPDLAEIVSVPSPDTGLSYRDIVQLGCQQSDDRYPIQAIHQRSAMTTYCVEIHAAQPEHLSELQRMIAILGGRCEDWTGTLIDDASDWYPDRLVGIALTGRQQLQTILTAWARQHSPASWFESE